MSDTECENGFRASRISIASDSRTDHKKVARELHTKPSVRNKFGNRGCIGESGFDPVELWFMGPPCGLKVGRGLTSCTVMIARQVRGQPVSYVGYNVGTKGEGRREPFSCSLNEAGQ